MTYISIIPQPGDALSVSQGQLLTNFSQLDIVFKEDHVPLPDATIANRGKHNKTTYVEQSADPATALNEMAFFSKVASGVTQLFYRNENNGTTQQMTFPFTKAEVGTFVLAGAIRLNWGTHTILAGQSSIAVTFAVPFSAIPYSAVATPHLSPASDSSRGFGATNQTANGFLAEVFNSFFAANTKVSWFAIGPV